MSEKNNEKGTEKQFLIKPVPKNPTEYRYSKYRK